MTMTRRKPWEVSDELWAVIEPLLPKHERRFRHPGRKRIDDRKTLQGVLSRSTRWSSSFVCHNRRFHPRLFPGLTCGISVPASTLRRDCPTRLRVWR
jgi:transposase